VTRIERAFAEVTANLSGPTAIIWHGGGMRTLFRHILHLPEPKEFGDCAWVRLEKTSGEWELIDSSGLAP
jgi:broad specificity phosphatase PhoE